MYRYDIYIDPANYNANLIANDAKIVWRKETNGVIFRKDVDGKFSLNRTGNEMLFDKLMSITFCESGMLSIYDSTGLIAQAGFSKKSLSISEDKCRIDIKFEKDDEYTGIYSILEKEVNMLTLDIPVKKVTSINLPLIEYTRYSGYVSSDSYWDIVKNIWRGDGKDKPIIPHGNSTLPPVSLLWVGWNQILDNAQYTLQQNVYKYVYPTPGSAFESTFYTTSFYARQVIYVTRLGEDQSSAPPNSGDPCDKYAWFFDSYDPITGLDKFARRMEISNFVASPNMSYPINKGAVISYTGFYQSDCYSETHRYTRCRKLNDVIKALIAPYFTDFESEFLKSKINPISNKDLSNLLISQKSDCIGTTSDPAIKANITLKGVLTMLQNIFNIFWAIDENGKFRIEHKKYWDNNGSYTVDNNVDNNVDIDLTLVYPTALIGSNEYSFEDNIPIREKFSFMESWRKDFIGKDIDYSDCIKTGDEIEYSATIITTDIDPSLMLSYASKDGFALFHCHSDADDDGAFGIFSEPGTISNMIYENMHLSWANLHEYYWKYGRYLPYGKMNDKQTVFDVRPLKYQKAISFPYCVSEFNPKKLIKTNLGNGIVRSASFSFKTNFITVELEYIDNI